MILPNFIICGVPKAGTSSIYRWLADHPEVSASKEKETYFFVDPDSHMYDSENNIEAGLGRYSENFEAERGGQTKIVMEATPSYIYSNAAIKWVPRLSSAPKCLFVVREPSAQIYSQYLYFKNTWSWIPGGLSFQDYVSLLKRSEASSSMFGGNELAANALENAHYVRFLRGWRTVLEGDRMLVASFEQMRSSPLEFMREVCVWLGLDPGFFSDYSFPVENETYQVRNKMLQALNMSIRSRIPKGFGYDILRRAYRRVNTTHAAPDDVDAQKTKLELAEDYIRSNTQLQSEFSVQLPGWQVE